MDESPRRKLKRIFDQERSKVDDRAALERAEDEKRRYKLEQDKERLHDMAELFKTGANELLEEIPEPEQPGLGYTIGRDRRSFRLKVGEPEAASGQRYLDVELTNGGWKVTVRGLKGTTKVGEAYQDDGALSQARDQLLMPLLEEAVAAVGARTEKHRG